MVTKTRKSRIYSHAAIDYYGQFAKFVYDLHLQGLSTCDIADKLNQSGFKAFRGGRIGNQHVSKILLTEEYHDIKTGGELVMKNDGYVDVSEQCVLDYVLDRPIERPSVRVKRLHQKATMPVYKTQGAAGCDLSACLDQTLVIKSMETVRVGTGIALDLTNTSLYAEVYLRSGLTAKHLTLANGVGVIDTDYTGEIIVALTNTSRFYAAVIEPGERIAQLVFKERIVVDLIETDNLSYTQRGAGGFGSTGKL